MSQKYIEYCFENLRLLSRDLHDMTYSAVWVIFYPKKQSTIKTDIKKKIPKCKCEFFSQAKEFWGM